MHIEFSHLLTENKSISISFFHFSLISCQVNLCSCNSPCLVVVCYGIMYMVVCYGIMYMYPISSFKSVAYSICELTLFPFFLFINKASVNNFYKYQLSTRTFVSKTDYQI